jgi:hypothetical protein
VAHQRRGPGDRFCSADAISVVAHQRREDLADRYHGSALALPEKVAVARPTGVGRVLATYEIPIEGRDEWVAAARRLA